MKILFRLAALLAIATLAACATAPQVEYTQRANFASYHSFYWRPVKHQPPVSNPILDSEILDQRVRAAAVHTLAGHGYQQVSDAKQADFIVTYQTASEQHLHSRSGLRFGFGVGYPFYFGPYWDPFFGAMYYPTPAYDIESYQEGYLIIDIIDSATDDLVWRGWNQTAVTPRNFSRDAVNDMVTRILGAFPPP